MARGIEGAKVLLTTCSNCKKDEKILIVTDPTSYEIAMAMWEAAKDFPQKTLVMMEERKTHGHNPPPLTVAAMVNAEVIFVCTKFSLFHSQAKKDAVAAGVRYVNMVDYSIEMMEKGGLFCDFTEEGKTVAYVADRLRGGKNLELTAECGTYMTCSIESRGPNPSYGVSLKPGTASAPPDLECATCAVEGTANGVVYIDASIPHPDIGLIKEPIKLTIEKGLIVDISGGKEAEILARVFKEVNNPNAYNVGEIGLGLNSMARLNGKMLEDEGCGGTLHLGCGDNIGFGGGVSCPIHMDLILNHPTVKVDGKPILNKGEVVR